LAKKSFDRKEFIEVRPLDTNSLPNPFVMVELRTRRGSERWEPIERHLKNAAVLQSHDHIIVREFKVVCPDVVFAVVHSTFLK